MQFDAKGVSLEPICQYNDHDHYHRGVGCSTWYITRIISLQFAEYAVLTSYQD